MLGIPQHQPFMAFEKCQEIKKMDFYTVVLRESGGYWIALFKVLIIMQS